MNGKIYLIYQGKKRKNSMIYHVVSGKTSAGHISACRRVYTEFVSDWVALESIPPGYKLCAMCERNQKQDRKYKTFLEQ